MSNHTFNYPLVAQFFHDIADDLKAANWEPVVTFDSEPRVDIGTRRGPDWVPEASLSVAHGLDPLTVKLRTHLGSTLAFRVGGHPTDADLETQRTRVLRALRWNPYTVAATVTNVTDTVLDVPWAQDTSLGATTLSYLGALPGGRPVQLTFDWDPTPVEATLIADRGKPDEITTSALLSYTTDAQEVADDFVSFLKWCLDPVKELRRRLLSEIPESWSVELAGNTLLIGPTDADDDPAPYEVLVDAGAPTRVTASFWSDLDPSPCDCCDDTPGYDPLFTYEIRDGSDFEDLIYSLSDTIRFD